MTDLEERLEQLKREFVIDKLISEIYETPVPVIEKNLDPILRDMVKTWLQGGT